MNGGIPTRGHTCAPSPLFDDQDHCKVLLVSPLPPPPGGIATWSAIVIQEMRKRHDVRIDLLDTAVKWRSSNDFRLVNRLLGGSLQALGTLVRFVGALRRLRPHLVHLCSSASFSVLRDIVMLALCRSFAVPSILHYRFGRIPALAKADTWEWKAIRLSMQLANAVIVLDKESETTAKAVLPFAAIERVANPVDVSEIQGPFEEERPCAAEWPLKIVFVGHVVPGKGITELVQACLMLDGLAFTLDIVGNVEGRFQNELARMAGRHAEGKWLRFRGPLDRRDALRILNSAHVFVLPSHTEGFPNVILEAMALGKAIVATRVGAIPEILDENGDELCGCVVSPHDVKELCLALRQLLTDAGQRHRLGANARARAARLYSVEAISQRYVQLWHELARKKQTTTLP